MSLTVRRSPGSYRSLLLFSFKNQQTGDPHGATGLLILFSDIKDTIYSSSRPGRHIPFGVRHKIEYKQKIYVSAHREAELQQQLQYVSVSRRCQSKETYKNAPDSYEAGSPNFAGVVGMAKAMSILDEVGFDAIEQHEKVLNRRLIDGLKKIDNIIIYGDHENIEDRVGVVTFNFEDLNSYLVAVSLTDES